MKVTNLNCEVEASISYEWPRCRWTSHSTNENLLFPDGWSFEKSIEALSKRNASNIMAEHEIYDTVISFKLIEDNQNLCPANLKFFDIEVYSIKMHGLNYWQAKVGNVVISCPNIKSLVKEAKSHAMTQSFDFIFIR